MNGNEEAGTQVKINAAIKVITFGVTKIGGAVISQAKNAKNCAKYGENVIAELKNSGFTTAEVNAQISKLSKLGCSQTTIETLLKNPKCMFLGDDILNVISKSGSFSDDLARLVLNQGDDFSKLVVNTFADEGVTGVKSLIGIFGDSYLVWYRITATADNMASTSIPATFQVRLKVDYVNPKTSTNVLWTNANATEHMGEYISQFGGENFSMNLRSQLMLESYTSALDEAMEYLITQPAGRYENLSYGGWAFGINTSTGTVFHAFPEWVIS